MVDIVIISESDSENLGDQAISQALVAILADLGDVSCASFSGSSTASTDRTATRASNGLVQLLKSLVRLVPINARSRIRFHLFGGQRALLLHYEEAIRDARLVLFGGGQLIKNNAALFCDRMYILHTALKEASIPHAILSVGVDAKMSPLTWRLARSFIAASEFVVVRDTASKERIEEAKCRIDDIAVIPDPVFALPNPYLNQERPDRDIPLAINVIDTAAALNGTSGRFATANELIATYLELAQMQTGAVLFTSGTTADLVVARRVAEMLRARTDSAIEIFHPSSVDELLVFLAKTDKIVASRMHVGIFSFISRCNFLALCWDPKVVAVWHDLSQGDRVVNLDQFAQSDSASTLLAQLERQPPPTADTVNEVAEVVSRLIRDQLQVGGRD